MKPQYLTVGFCVLASVLILALALSVLSLKLTPPRPLILAPTPPVARTIQQPKPANTQMEAVVRIKEDETAKQSVDIQR